jgi:uncharacterized protein YgfB (UPF0149 family)
MNHMHAPDFDALAEALSLVGALGEPAEIHGHLCGLSCVLGTDAGAAWMADTLADAAEEEAVRLPAELLLAGLARQTWAALDEGDMSFTLLLPTDDSDIATRAESLGHWCHGFLQGLGAGAADTDLLEQGTTGEIVHDFSEIARAGLDPDAEDAEAENAYAELVEFVRVGVQLLFEELRGARVQPGARVH